MSPLTLTLTLTLFQPPSAAPKPVPATRDDIKQSLEGHKKARPRLPAPPADPDGRGGVNNGRFRAYYLPEFGGAAGGRDPDPAMTLDSTFKVKLFWVTSRANNCYYCLGHQEHKLAAAGVSDADIAVLDGDWVAFAPAERAALAFTRKLTHSPHRIDADDVATLTARYTPTQALELLVTVAGYNATNRWTDGLNIPAEESGSRFGREGSKHDFSTFKSPTDAAFAGQVTRVAPLAADATASGKPYMAPRPKLEPRAEVESLWAAARTRKPLLPQATDVSKDLWPAGDAPQWVRLLATFPKAMAGRIAGLPAAAEKGTLPNVVKAEIAWACARDDRAWYALAVARDRLKAMGWTDDQVFAFDGGNDRPAAETAAVAFARKLSAAPATVTDQDVEGLRKLYTDKQVAEIVHHTCNAAFFDRMTEAANLPLDR